MTDRQLTAALAGSAAASAAVTGPVRDLARPWRWVVHTDSLDLYADRHRTAAAETRLVLISGGGALHHARVALAADGLAARVSLLPDADPDHLARLTASGRIEVTQEAKALFEATEHRPGGGRPAGETPRSAAAALVEAAAAEGVRLRIEEETGATYAVLHGDEDTPEAWLRAGEALSAVSLAATLQGLTVVSYPAVTDVPARSEVIQRLLEGAGTPYLALLITAVDRDAG